MSTRGGRNNERSLLLSDQENEAIFNVLGSGRVTLATAVVQLFLADSGNQQSWNKKLCGVVCFVKDNPKRSYFLRIYETLNQQKLWEQELYVHFKYKTPKDFFHTFEADDCQAGLNFASVDEAEKFKRVIQGKLLDRQKRRLEKKRQQDGRSNLPSRPIIDIGGNTHGQVPSMPPQIKVGTNTPKGKDKQKGKGKKKITKADISTPTQFRHIGHVGWDPESGLQTEKLDPEMKALFEEIGLNDHSEVDEDTIDFIYDFVDKHGGLKAVRDDLARRKPPPAPPSGPAHATIGKSAPSLPSRPGFAAPSPPVKGPVHSLNTSRPSRPLPAPPPTPSREGRDTGTPVRDIPAPPPLNIPAPPPPPPTISGGPPPPPIKKNAGTSSPSPPVSSGRAGLLDEIVKFKSSTLQPRKDDRGSERPAPTSEAPGGGGIAAALMDALNKRKPKMQFSDDEGSSDEMDTDDDDEWED